MAIKITQLPRGFSYNGVDLPDVSADMTPEQVKDVYSATYPEITSASIEGPEHKGGKLVYTFRRAVGTKGSASMYPPVKLNGPRLTQLRKRGDGFVYVEIRAASKPASHPLLDLVHQSKNLVAQGIERLLSISYPSGH